MAGGWTRDGSVQDQIDASVEDAVNLEFLPPSQLKTAIQQLPNQVKSVW